MTAFSLAGLAIVLLMFGLSLAIATAQEVVQRMADVGTVTVKRWGGRILIGVGLWLIVLALGAHVFARFVSVHPPAEAQMGMGQPGTPTPPVKGFAKGQEISFIHTEASDPQVASMLTRMMGPKVLVVPTFKEIPSRLLATVFVFRNGVKGEGPFGFQPDVFDAVPGEPTYTPLRRITFVVWRQDASPIILGSIEDVQRAQARGQVALTQTDVVVNMPFLTWPGGQR